MKKTRMLKRLAALFLAVVALSMALPVAFACDTLLLDEGVAIEFGVEESEEAEETATYFKTSAVDGLVYYRIWSLTRGIWLTDWILLPGQV